jgi:hypothetical protein
VARYETDIVSDGTISLENAENRLRLYREVLMKLYPIINLDPSVTLEELRIDTPTKFLVIMSTTSLIISDDQSRQNECLVLLNRAYEAVVYDVMLVGSKTFELLECLILLTCWYNEPAFYHQLKCNLLTHLMVSMATDLGMAGMSIGKNSPSLKYERIIRPQVLVDATSIECRKLWLFVYCSTATFFTLTRKSTFTLWSRYTEECCELLAVSDLTIEEKRVVFFAKVAHIFEEISTALYSNSTGPSPPSILDPRVIYLVRYFEEKLKTLYESVKYCADMYEPFYHAVQVYLHQLVIYVPYDENLGRTPFSEYSLAVGQFETTSESVSCLSWCLSSSMRCIELFHSQLDEGLAALPFFAFSRYIYCVAMVLKVHTLVLLTPGLDKICPVSPEQIGLIRQVSSRLDLISRKFIFSNSILSFNFIVKLLIMFFDRQVEVGLAGRDGNTDKATPRRDGLPNGNVNPIFKPNSQLKKSESLPGSPLDILSTVAVDSRRQSQVNFDTPYSMKAKGPVKVSGSGDEEEDYPYWLMSDDFWKDMIPNIEAFTGYDVL